MLWDNLATIHSATPPSAPPSLHEEPEARRMHGEEQEARRAHGEEQQEEWQMHRVRLRAARPPSPYCQSVSVQALALQAVECFERRSPGAQWTSFGAGTVLWRAAEHAVGHGRPQQRLSLWEQAKGSWERELDALDVPDPTAQVPSSACFRRLPSDPF